MKKIITIALLSAMMAVSVAGCGSTDAPAKTDTESKTTTDTAKDSSDSAVSDETFEAIQTQYSALVDVYNIIKDEHESGNVTMDDSQLEVFNQAADIINEMGDISQDDFTSEDEAETFSKSIGDLATSLGKIYDAAGANNTDSSAAISDKDFAGIQETFSKLVDLYNTVKDGVESNALTLTADQQKALDSTADIINEMGNIDKSDIKSQEDAVSLLDSMGTLADVLGSVVE